MKNKATNSVGEKIHRSLQIEVLSSLLVFQEKQRARLSMENEQELKVCREEKIQNSSLVSGSGSQRGLRLHLRFMVMNYK